MCKTDQEAKITLIDEETDNDHGWKEEARGRITSTLQRGGYELPVGHLENSRN